MNATALILSIVSQPVFKKCAEYVFNSATMSKIVWMSRTNGSIGKKIGHLLLQLRKSYEHLCVS